MSKIEEYKRRYHAAAHSMQSGVATEMQVDPDGAGTSPKHLRTGLNASLVEQSALAGLLLAKGIFTEEEYYKVIAEAMEAEQQRYEKILTEKIGRTVSLG